MKITKGALVVACLMAGLSCAMYVLFAVTTEQMLCKKLIPLQEEGLENMHASQEMITNFHYSIYLQLAFAAWYLVLAGLLVFAIRRLPSSN